MARDTSVTEWLRRWSGGESEAFGELIERVYDDLHDIAARCFRRERSEHTLQATALLHEAMLRLIDIETLPWKNRGHFYALIARMMRRLLVDHARQHRRLKRGAGGQRVTLSLAEPLGADAQNPDVEALEEALERLAARDPQKARIVELRFFTGLTLEEIARCLDISISTVTREWRRTRTWLYCELKGVSLDG